MVWVPALAGLPREQYLRGHSSSPRLQLGILIWVCVCEGGDCPYVCQGGCHCFTLPGAGCEGLRS